MWQSLFYLDALFSKFNLSWNLKLSQDFVLGLRSHFLGGPRLKTAALWHHYTVQKHQMDLVPALSVKPDRMRGDRLYCIFIWSLLDNFGKTKLCLLWADGCVFHLHQSFSGKIRGRYKWQWSNQTERLGKEDKKGKGKKQNKIISHVCLRIICFNQCLCCPCTPAFPSSPPCCLSICLPPLLFPEGPAVNFDLHKELVKCLCNPCVCMFLFTVFSFFSLPCPWVRVCNPQAGHLGVILSWSIRSLWLISQSWSFTSLTNKPLLSFNLISAPNKSHHPEFCPIWNTGPWGFRGRRKIMKLLYPVQSFKQCQLRQPLWVKTDDPVWSDSESLTSVYMPVSSSQPWCSSQHGMQRNALRFSWITTQDMNQLALLPFTQKKGWGKSMHVCTVWTDIENSWSESHGLNKDSVYSVAEIMWRNS